MTKDFIAIARTRRLIALNVVENRKHNGASITKIHTMSDMPKRHVDAIFRTRRSAQPAVFVAPLAA